MGTFVLFRAGACFLGCLAASLVVGGAAEPPTCIVTMKLPHTRTVTRGETFDIEVHRSDCDVADVITEVNLCLESEEVGGASRDLYMPRGQCTLVRFEPRQTVRTEQVVAVNSTTLGAPTLSTRRASIKLQAVMRAFGGTCATCRAPTSGQCIHPGVNMCTDMPVSGTCPLGYAACPKADTFPITVPFVSPNKLNVQINERGLACQVSIVSASAANQRSLDVVLARTGDCAVASTVTAVDVAATGGNFSSLAEMMAGVPTRAVFAAGTTATTVSVVIPSTRQGLPTLDEMLQLSLSHPADSVTAEGTTLPRHEPPQAWRTALLLDSNSHATSINVVIPAHDPICALSFEHGSNATVPTVSIGSTITLSLAREGIYCNIGERYTANISWLLSGGVVVPDPFGGPDRTYPQFSLAPSTAAGSTRDPSTGSDFPFVNLFEALGTKQVTFPAGHGMVHLEVTLLPYERPYHASRGAVLTAGPAEMPSQVTSPDDFRDRAEFKAGRKAGCVVGFTQTTLTIHEPRFANSRRVTLKVQRQGLACENEGSITLRWDIQSFGASLNDAVVKHGNLTILPDVPYATFDMSVLSDDLVEEREMFVVRLYGMETSSATNTLDRAEILVIIPRNDQPSPTTTGTLSLTSTQTSTLVSTASSTATSSLTATATSSATSSAASTATASETSTASVTAASTLTTTATVTATSIFDINRFIDADEVERISKEIDAANAELKNARAAMANLPSGADAAQILAAQRAIDTALADLDARNTELAAAKCPFAANVCIKADISRLQNEVDAANAKLAQVKQALDSLPQYTVEAKRKQAQDAVNQASAAVKTKSDALADTRLKLAEEIVKMAMDAVEQAKDAVRNLPFDADQVARNRAQDAVDKAFAGAEAKQRQLKAAKMAVKIREFEEQAAAASNALERAKARLNNLPLNADETTRRKAQDDVDKTTAIAKARADALRDVKITSLEEQAAAARNALALAKQAVGKLPPGADEATRKKAQAAVARATAEEQAKASTLKAAVLQKLKDEVTEANAALQKATDALRGLPTDADAATRTKARDAVDKAASAAKVKEDELAVAMGAQPTVPTDSGSTNSVPSTVGAPEGPKYLAQIHSIVLDFFANNLLSEEQATSDVVKQKIQALFLSRSSLKPEDMKSLVIEQVQYLGEQIVRATVVCADGTKAALAEKVVGEFQEQLQFADYATLQVQTQFVLLSIFNIKYSKVYEYRAVTRTTTTLTTTTTTTTATTTTATTTTTTTATTATTATTTTATTTTTISTTTITATTTSVGEQRFCLFFRTLDGLTSDLQAGKHFEFVLKTQLSDALGVDFAGVRIVDIDYNQQRMCVAVEFDAKKAAALVSVWLGTLERYILNYEVVAVDDRRIPIWASSSRLPRVTTSAKKSTTQAAVTVTEVTEITRLAAGGNDAVNGWLEAEVAGFPRLLYIIVGAFVLLLCCCCLCICCQRQKRGQAQILYTGSPTPIPRSPQSLQSPHLQLHQGRVGTHSDFEASPQAYDQSESGHRANTSGLHPDFQRNLQELEYGPNPTFEPQVLSPSYNNNNWDQAGAIEKQQQQARQQQLQQQQMQMQQQLYGAQVQHDALAQQYPVMGNYDI